MTALRENCPDSRASTSKMMCLQWGSLIYTLEFTADSPRSTPAFVSNAYFRGVGNPRTTSGLSVVNPGLNWRAPVMQNSTRREYWPQEDTHKPQSRFKKKKKSIRVTAVLESYGSKEKIKCALKGQGEANGRAASAARKTGRRERRRHHQREGAKPPNFQRLSRVAPTPVTSRGKRAGNLERSTSTSHGCSVGSRVCTYDHR